MDLVKVGISALATTLLRTPMVMRADNKQNRTMATRCVADEKPQNLPEPPWNKSFFLNEKQTKIISLTKKTFLFWCVSQTLRRKKKALVPRRMLSDATFECIWMSES